MVNRFKYQVIGTAPDVTVHISQVLWPRLWRATLWSGAWVAIAYSCVRWFGFTGLSLVGILVCLLLALAGLFMVEFSAALNTLSFRSNTVTWREIRPFTWRTRCFPIFSVRDLGFAFFSHGGPVLRIDVDGTWYSLAEGVHEHKVMTLVSEIKRRGIVIPISSADLESVASVPKFWVQD
jgi:hypothetical protein